jgi:hypothetical protein
LGEPKGSPLTPSVPQWYIDDISLCRIRYWAPHWNRGYGGIESPTGIGGMGDVSPTQN